VDECAYDPPICSQVCNNSAPGFTCSCVAGYRLLDDHRHCEALHWKTGAPYLIYVQTDSIYQVSVKHGTSALPSLIHRSRKHIFSLGILTNFSAFALYIIGVAGEYTLRVREKVLGVIYRGKL